MRKVVLIIPNPRERLFVSNILALAGVKVVGEAASIDEAREDHYSTVSTVADALLISGADIVPPGLWGFGAQPATQFEGQFTTICVFKRKQPGVNRPAIIGHSGRG